MQSRFDSPLQRLAIVAMAAAALLAVLASSPPSCPMSVTARDESLLATGGYERRFTVESTAPAVGVVSVFLESASVARVLVEVIPDRLPNTDAMPTAQPATVELAPGVRNELEFPPFLEGVRVRVELETRGDVALDVAVTVAQDDCQDNAFVKVIDG